MRRRRHVVTTWADLSLLLQATLGEIARMELQLLKIRLTLTQVRLMLKALIFLRRCRNAWRRLIALPPLAAMTPDLSKDAPPTSRTAGVSENIARGLRRTMLTPPLVARLPLLRNMALEHDGLATTFAMATVVMPGLPLTAESSLATQRTAWHTLIAAEISHNRTTVRHAATARRLYASLTVTMYTAVAVVVGQAIGIASVTQTIPWWAALALGMASVVIPSTLVNTAMRRDEDDLLQRAKDCPHLTTILWPEIHDAWMAWRTAFRALPEETRGTISPEHAPPFPLDQPTATDHTRPASSATPDELEGLCLIDLQPPGVATSWAFPATPSR